MKAALRLGLACLLFVAFGLSARAHVGSPHIVFEGRAGSFPVRVVVRQPDVVPGLADISVRVLAGSPTRVGVLPLHWSTDKTGAPRPDVAEPVPGETNLFTAALWFMARGAYGVEVQVDGPGGGAVIVPVNSIAYERRPMPASLGAVLAGLGFLLAAGVIGIAAAAAREATLPQNVVPGRARALWSLAAGVVALVVVGFALYGGSRWWQSEDGEHQRRILFRQFAHTLNAIPGANGTELRLEITDPRRDRDIYRLAPDHGKLIHQFLIAENVDGDGLSVFAHLHPVTRGAHQFAVTLPSLPAGQYRVFTDLTHEPGYTQTLTNSLVLALPTAAGAAPSDPADAAIATKINAGDLATLGDDLVMAFTAGPVVAGDVSILRARVTRADGSPAQLQPYLRMLGHAVVMRADGSVFAHLHPAGTLSMAAARTFAAKLGGEAEAREADVNCGDLEAVPPDVAAALGRTGAVSFPYVFPRPGRYYVWVQVKVAGEVRTGGFAVEVLENKAFARR